MDLLPLSLEAGLEAGLQAGTFRRVSHWTTCAGHAGRPGIPDGADGSADIDTGFLPAIITPL